MHLHFLGTGNTVLPQGRSYSLLLINRSILLDCPYDVLPQMRRAQVSPAHINAVALTHWHADHCAGLSALALERQRMEAPTLDVYGPPGGQELLTHRCELDYEGFLGDWCRDKMRYHSELNARIPDTDVWLTRFRVQHFGRGVSAHGYLLRQGKLTVMHTGDSGPCDAIASRIPQCQVVIIEMGLEEPSDFHFCPEAIRFLAARHPQVQFLVTHTFCGVGEEPNLGPNVRHMYDGRKVPL